jgi:hypothetical protein
MKRIPVLMFLGIFMVMSLVLLSCATAEKDQDRQESSVSSGQAQAETVTADAVKETAQADTAAAKAEETPVVAAGFLADTHKAAGVECSDCHQEKPPASEVPTTMCMTCHEDYRDVAASAIDPHNAHVEFTRCGDCHHAHRESENQCLSCHTFSLKTP